MQNEACVRVSDDQVPCKRCHTLFSSFVNDSVASMNFLFLSWWRSSIWSNSASNFLCDTRHTGTTVVTLLTDKTKGSAVCLHYVTVTRPQFDHTWWTIKDWTWRLRTCMRAVVTTDRTSGTTLSLRISLIRRWLRWKRDAAECFIENPSS